MASFVTCKHCFLNVFFRQDRQKILTECPADTKNPLFKLNKSVIGNSIDEFFDAVEPAFTAICLLLRKPDKKKERYVVRTSLLKTSVVLILIIKMIYTTPYKNSISQLKFKFQLKLVIQWSRLLSTQSCVTLC